MVHRHAAADPSRDPLRDSDASTLRPLDAPAASESDPAAADRDERLGEAIEVFLERAEGGSPPDPLAFAAEYPDLGDDLVAALEGLALVKGLVGGPGGPGHRLEEGRRVAGYRIVREIGRGGMGVVYEAVHVGLDRPVALKVLGSQAAPDSSGRRRFLNEARTAAGLHHTHIVPVFDVGQVGGLCYYAMQRIEGSGLDGVLKVLRRDRTVASGSTGGSTLRPGKARSGPAVLPPVPTLGDETLSWAGAASGPVGARWRGGDGEADNDDPPAFSPPRGSGYYRWVAHVGRQAAEALAHAHQRGIIHRDIKPSNLLVDARGTIWVADFGLARRLADPSQTQVDSLLGTPRYMSPEQARTGAIDGRADVYSLGATLYELITLRPPFDGQTAAELIDQITGREPQRPRKFDARVPLDLETILLKALAKRPADRYSGAAELADDLGRFLAHEPVLARRIGPVGRTWRFARRHPGASIVSVLATTVVLATATVAYVRVVGERNRADDQARDATRARESTEAINRQLQAAVLEGLEKQVTNTRFTAVANRRADGLKLIREASTRASLMKADPNPDLRVRLRDQALAFLTARDVQDRPPIATKTPRRGLVFGPSSQRIAALDDDGELAVWDLGRAATPAETSGQPIAPAREQRRGPGSGGGGGGSGRGGRGSFASQGDRIARAGDQVAVVQPDRLGVWWFDPAAPDKPVGPRLATPGQRITSILAADDGQHILTLGDPDTPDRARREPDEVRVCLWDRRRPEAPLMTLPVHRAEGMLWRPMVALAPDGSRVAVGRNDEAKVLLFNGAGEPLEPVSVSGVASALALGPGGILAVAHSGEIALWDLADPLPKQLPPLDSRQSIVYALRFSPRDGSMLATAGSGGGVELWDLATHSNIAALPTSEAVDDLAFAPDGRTLAAAQASGIALWSVVEPAAQVALPESGDFPTSLAFGPGDLLAIASRDGSLDPAGLQLWGGPGQCPPSIVAWPRHHPTSVAFDALDRLITTEADALRWFRPPGPDPVAAVPFPDQRPAPRPDRDRRGDSPPPTTGRPAQSQVLARTPDGMTMLVYRRESLYLCQGRPPGTLTHLDPGERGFFDGGRRPTLALAPGGARLYYLARRGEALAARPIDGAGFGRPDWSVEVTGAATIALSPDGSTLAVGHNSGLVELRDARDGHLRHPLPVPNKDDAGPVEALAFGPDGRTLAVGGRKQVRLWAVGDTPQPLVRLPGYRGSVRTLAFDRIGQRLAAADEKTVKVWDLDQLAAELGRLGLAW